MAPGSALVFLAVLLSLYAAFFLVLAVAGRRGEARWRPKLIAEHWTGPSESAALIEQMAFGGNRRAKRWFSALGSL